MAFYGDIPDDLNTRFAMWARIEPRCRNDDFSQGIEARIADPLWMLARQWQMGEFQGEDSGSPIRVRVDYSCHVVREIASGNGNATRIPVSPPLECLVEREPVPMTWRLRIRIGQQFERFARQKLGSAADAVICTCRKPDYFPVQMPTSDQLPETDHATRSYLTLMAGRAIDGDALLEAIHENPSKLSELLNEIPADLRNNLQQVFSELMVWYAQLYSQPDDPKETAWNASELNYQFKMTAYHDERAPNGGTIEIDVRDYRNGELDWYSGELKQGAQQDSKASIRTLRLNPSRVGFAGKPNERWWTFEDNNVDFGRIDVATTDLAKLLLMEFAFVYADDWFMIPLTVPIGSLSRIHRLQVTDVFGQRYIIPRAAEDANDPLKRWQLFRLSGDNLPDSAKMNHLLYVPPAINFREESEAIEEVRFIRDEGANMVFAIEHTVLNKLGKPVSGYEAQLERHARQRESQIADLENQLALVEQIRPATVVLFDEDEHLLFVPAPQREADLKQQALELQAEIERLRNPLRPGDTTATPQYRLASLVPDNWIPYVPVNAMVNDESKRLPHVNDYSIRLRQANMLRNEDDDQPKRIEPRTRILNGDGMDGELEWLNEEAVPRAGVKVQLTKQRVRWFDGKTYVWVGRKVKTGRGEGSSALRFDFSGEK